MKTQKIDASIITNFQIKLGISKPIPYPLDLFLSVRNKRYCVGCEEFSKFCEIFSLENCIDEITDGLLFSHENYFDVYYEEDRDCLKIEVIGSCHGVVMQNNIIEYFFSLLCTFCDKKLSTCGVCPSCKNDFILKYFLLSLIIDKFLIAEVLLPIALYQNGDYIKVKNLQNEKLEVLKQKREKVSQDKMNNIEQNESSDD